MTEQEKSLTFEVDRKKWDRTRVVEDAADVDLEQGEVRFRVDRFALTSNNISYISAGDMLNYWSFFPAGDGFGRVPAMGFADVVESKHDDVAVGTRCFGFFPMGRHLVIAPESATTATLTDGVAHRQPTALVYRQYNVTTADALYSAEHEDEIMLLRGLFMTSFLAEDFLMEGEGGPPLFGAEQIIIASASSKTGIALAFVAKQRGAAHVVGLTSERNRAFVEGLGFHDEVHTYEEVGALDATRPGVLVDMAGSTAVTRAVHEHLGANLKYSQRIGNTHWDEGGGGEDIPGVVPEFFFAPGQIQKRVQDWGPAGLQERIGESLRGFLGTTGQWLDVRRGQGPKAVEEVYREILAGRADPRVGHVLSMWEDDRADGTDG